MSETFCAIAWVVAIVVGYALGHHDGRRWLQRRQERRFAERQRRWRPY